MGVVFISSRKVYPVKRLRFNLFYLFGNPRWDTGVVPPEVTEYVEHHPPGRALDIGCGTGTNLLHLAQHGWQAEGIDFSWLAVRRARRRLTRAGFPASAWIDDATRLTKAQGVYNYILDIGCFHQLSAAGKQAEIESVQAHLASGGCWMIYGHCWDPQGTPGHGLTETDISTLADNFILTRRVNGQEGTRGPSVWLWLERKGL